MVARSVAALRTFGSLGPAVLRQPTLRPVHFPWAERHDRPLGRPRNRTSCFALTHAFRTLKLVRTDGPLLQAEDLTVPALRLEALFVRLRDQLAWTAVQCSPTATWFRKDLILLTDASALRVGGDLCRPSTRPVLKHGPRSLTCARVIGFVRNLKAK